MGVFEKDYLMRQVHSLAGFLAKLLLDKEEVPYEEAEEREPATMPGSGSFYFRTVLCLLIFLGLLFLRRENRSVFGLSPEELQETISSGVLLQETTEDMKK